MSNFYERFCEGSLPEDFQKRCEDFASVADSMEEKFFRAGFRCGIKIGEDKNKWHFVKGGCYPDEEGLYLLYWKDGDITVNDVYIDGNCEPYTLSLSNGCSFNNIIAWRKVILPKED